MSLFKARDWWSTVVQTEGGDEEECDAGCLVIANINNEDPPKDKIVVGGFSGSLRIFNPQVSNIVERFAGMLKFVRYIFLKYFSDFFSSASSLFCVLMNVKCGHFE